MSANTKRRVCYFYDGTMCAVLYTTLTLYSRRWKLLLWSGSPHEAPSHPHDTQPSDQLWAVPADANLCARAPFTRKTHFTKRPPRCGDKEMTKFHADDYVNFLRQVTPDTTEEFSRQLQRCARCLSSLSIFLVFGFCFLLTVI